MDGNDQSLDIQPTGIISYDPASSCPKCGKMVDVLSVHWDIVLSKLVFIRECKPCKTRYRDA